MGLSDYPCAIYGTTGIIYDAKDEKMQYQNTCMSEDIFEEDKIPDCLDKNFVLDETWFEMLSIEHMIDNPMSSKGELYESVVDYVPDVTHIGSDLGYVTVYHFPKNLKVSWNNIFKNIREKGYTKRKKILIPYSAQDSCFRGKNLLLATDGYDWCENFDKDQIEDPENFLKLDWSQDIVGVFCSYGAYIHFVKNKKLTRKISNLELVSVASRFGVEYKNRTRKAIYSDIIAAIKTVMNL